MTRAGSGPAAPETSPDESFVDLAGRLADAAGAISMTYFRSSLTVEAKADQSPVTVADKEAEAAMRALIEDAFPDHGIIGEEMQDKNPEAEFVWGGFRARRPGNFPGRFLC